jgi:16S rRNA processing protein RimM
LIGASVMQDTEVLGVVTEIQRITDTDYLIIKTDAHLVESGLPRSFLLPYIPRYIIDADVEAQKIFTKDAKDILEAS